MGVWGRLRCWKRGEERDRGGRGRLEVRGVYGREIEREGRGVEVWGR